MLLDLPVSTILEEDFGLELKTHVHYARRSGGEALY